MGGDACDAALLDRPACCVLLVPVYVSLSLFSGLLSYLSRATYRRIYSKSTHRFLHLRNVHKCFDRTLRTIHLISEVVWLRDECTISPPRYSCESSD